MCFVIVPLLLVVFLCQEGMVRQLLTSCAGGFRLRGRYNRRVEDKAEAFVALGAVSV